MFMKLDTELKFKRSNSNTSIDSSNVDSNNGQQQLQNKEVNIRLCFNCSHLLNKKYQSMKDKSNKPKIFSLYDVSTFFMV